MKKTPTARIAALLLASLGWASRSSAAAIDELDAGERAQVERGQPVVFTAPGPRSVWPQIWIYQRIEGTPAQAMAVFADYARQREYIPDLLASNVTRRIDPATADVTYELDTHFFLHPREDYTVRDRISRYGEGADCYRMDWNLVWGQDLHGAVGYARFEPLGGGATLLAYYNFVTPPRMAALFSGREVSGVEAAVAKLAARVAYLRVANPGLLEQELAALRAALGPSGP